jgi:glycerol-3-phosphate acyltransferase PlsY
MAPALWVLGGPAAGIYGAASALLIVFMHRANIARLRAGTESVLPLFRREKSKA